MTDRARWNGAEPIRVYDSEGSVYDPPIDTVVPGGLLTSDAPARVRDELIKRGDGWSAQKDPGQARAARGNDNGAEGAEG